MNSCFSFCHFYVGTASSLLKNIKESSQQYIGTSSSSSGAPVPPVRPPPPTIKKPIIESSSVAPSSRHAPFTGPCSLELVNSSNVAEEEPQPLSPALLLDINDGAPTEVSGSSNLADLNCEPHFGGPTSQINNGAGGSQGTLDQLLSLYSTKSPEESVPTCSSSNMSTVGDLLGSFGAPPVPISSKNCNPAGVNKSVDPFDLLGSSDLLTTKVLNSSSSFQNLKIVNNTSSSSNPGSSVSMMGKKNCSSPNLSDLILGDLMEPSGGGSSNKNSHFVQTKPNYYIGSQKVEPAEPSKVTTAGAGEEKKKNTLDSVFSEILSEQGFVGSSKDGTNKTINDLRKQELLASGNADPIQIKVSYYSPPFWSVNVLPPLVSLTYFLSSVIKTCRSTSGEKGSERISELCWPHYIRSPGMAVIGAKRTCLKWSLQSR